MNTLATTLPAAPAANWTEQVRDYWRHRGIFFLVAGLVLAGVIALAILWPATYQSGGTILIEQQEIPQELVRSAVSSFADQRIQIISQRVMTTQNLLPLVERYNLYPDIRVNKPREVLLQKMRDDIGLKMISADVIDPRSGRPTQATIAFSVSYKSRSQELAYKVANDLASLYLNENLTSRTQMAAQTSTFFAEEAQRQQARIAELDKQLSDFKQQHQDELPELTQLNIQVAQRTELDYRDAENHVAALDSQKVLLEAQLAQINPTMQIYSDTGLRVMSAADRLKSLKSQLAGYKARYAPDHPDIVNTQREIDGLEKEVQADDGTSDIARQLDAAKASLARAQEKYAVDHPDVVRLSREVAELQRALAAAPPAGTAAKDKERAHADNPAYIQVKGQLDALTVDRESAIKKREELHAKLDEYERRLAKAPAVERQYREYVRDLDSAQQKYQEIRSKQTEAQVSQNLETEHKGERFTMIEPPLPPERPISPNRILILAMGLFLSLGSGAGAAVLRNSVDSAVRGVHDMRRLLGVPPLAAIPQIVTPRERLGRRRKLIVMVVAAAAGIAAILTVVHLFLRPLDVLWAGILRRFGVF